MYYPDAPRIPANELKEALKRAGCKDVWHGLELGKLAVTKGDPVRDVVASLRRNVPGLFR